MTHRDRAGARTIRLRNGLAAGYAEYGDPAGHPMLSLHGAPACRLMFAVADEAARRLRLRLVAPDRPGYGLSPPDHAATLDGRVGWLEAFADALRLERFSLLGISGGAPYAVALAAGLADRVSALALVSPLGPVAELDAADGGNGAVLARGHRMFFLRLPRHGWLLRPGAALSALAYRAAPQLFATAFARSLGGPDAVILARPAVRAALIEMTSEALRQGSGGATRDLVIYGRPWNVDFTRITAPAVLWQGLDDRVVPPQASVRLSQLIPGCRFHPVPGAGHFWIFDHLDEVLGELAQLAGALPGGSGQTWSLNP